MKQYIEELFEIRSSWVDSSRANKFDEGLGRLLKELYPDNAHFLYELLQNAEDAKATSVEFKLMDDRLVFEHNGREFVQADIEGITGIGTTKKKDDLNTIGKFGVGFKAVFSYTNSPHVHCDSCSFAITEMVCPVLLDHPADLREGITRFEFPFDNSKKPVEVAIKEIEEGLLDFSSATLLFLHNIREIRWKHGAVDRVLKLSEEKVLGDLPVFRMELGRSENPERWLRLSAPCKEASEQPVSIAFKLETEKTDKGRHAFQIVEANGKLCIFFPADKETTKLKFHVHAPFISTVARDSVPYTNADNISLRDQLVDLLVESLPLLRDEGLLTTDFLGVLSNDADSLNEFYEPFMSAVVEAMKIQPLVPVRSGGHAAVVELTHPMDRVHHLISDSDLEFLTCGVHRQWVAGAQQRNSRPDRFLRMLEIRSWGAMELQIRMGANKYEFDLSESDYDVDDYYDEESGDWVELSTEEIVAWLNRKDIEWIKRFYLFLGERGDPDVLRLIPLVMSCDETFQRAKRVVFQSEGLDADQLEGISVLHHEILHGRSDQKEKIKRFLVELGVSELDESHYIESLLRRYYSPSDKNRPSEKDHLEHVRRFVEYWKKAENAGTFSRYCVLFSEDEGGIYIIPAQAYLDSPLLETGLSSVCLGEKYLISERYEALGNWFVDFSKAIGAQHLVVPEKCSCNRNPFIEFSWHDSSSYYVDEDFRLPSSLSSHIDSKDQSVSLLIWKMMCLVSGEYLQAQHRKNSRYELQRQSSQLVQSLRQKEWVPSVDGNFYKPSEMIRDQLPKEFVYDDNNGWLTAVGFGDDAKKRAEKLEAEEFERQEATKRLRQDGIDLSHEEMKEFSEIPQEERRAMLEGRKREKRTAIFPESTPKNPERRGEKNKQNYVDAPEKTSERRTRTVRTSQPDVDPKTYLPDLYINEEEQLVCQMCELEMPFKLRDGSYYFEAVQLFDDAPKETHQPYLALCSVCAAKYKTLVKRHDGCIYSFKNALLTIEDALVFSLDMHDPNLEPLSLRFTETHLLGIRAVLGEESNG